MVRQFGYASTILAFIVGIVANFSVYADFGKQSTIKLDEVSSNKASLGKALFFDTILSPNNKQSCASCHAPQAGFADPTRQAVSAGAIEGRFTRRNAPTISYVKYVPARYFDKTEQHYVGGLFYDGRALDLATQMEGPMFSEAEMANPDKKAVIDRLRSNSVYLQRFQVIYGAAALKDTDSGMQQLADVITQYEKSPEVNPFSSKYDAYLAGKASLSEQEQRGLKVFKDEKKGNCAACHPHEKSDDGTPPLFTDFTYDNLGAPVNPKFVKLFTRKDLAKNKILPDRGLGEVTKKHSEDGLFRVPTLRNISKTGPYMHNGVFESLKEVVEFYNERDVSDKWGKPEVALNVNKDELGDLKLNNQEVDDLVAFLDTLTDGYEASK